MQLVPVLTVRLRKMFFINLFEVMQIERTLRTNALMNNEMLAVFLLNERM